MPVEENNELTIVEPKSVTIDKDVTSKIVVQHVSVLFDSVVGRAVG
jgi:hypothetical protein